MTRMIGPDCAIVCNLINTHTHTHAYTHVMGTERERERERERRREIWERGRGRDRVGRRRKEEARETAQELWTRSGTSIPHASSSKMQTEDCACGHPTAPFARPGACTRAHHTEEVTGSEGREGLNGVGSGIGVGGGNRDPNGGGNGDGD